uniref:Ig-like domain-containing protein n=1 Tax=Pygocentrus nattereri TaxID=42514 RepID=A0AAR2L788_PYGNA
LPIPELFSEVLDPLLALLVSEHLLLKCFHFCLELTFCSFVGPVEAVELNERMFISVKTGENHTLSCNVERSETNNMVWFKAAAGQSFPEIIYTHQNSSSRQCEISSSTSCSLYEFSKNILDQHHTGTYYCAVAVCGKIIFGNGTSVQLSKCSCVLLGTCSIFVLFMCNSINGLVFSAVCVAVICTQTILIHKLRKSEHCAGGKCSL